MITLWMRRHKHGAPVAGRQRFGALSDAAYDAVSRRLDFNGNAFSAVCDGDAVHECVAGAGRLH